MAHNTLAKLDRVLVAVLGVAFCAILLLLPAHAFISTWGGMAIGPLEVWKSWKEILIAVLVPVVVWLCVRRPDIVRTVWARWYNKLILVYVCLTLLLAVFSTASGQAVIAGLLMNLRFLAMFVLAQVIIASGVPWAAKLKAWAVGWLIGTGVVLAGLAILQVTVFPRDFLAQFGYNKDTTISPYILVDQNPNALRAFATMRGPNTLGAYLLMPLALALLVWQARKNWWAIGAAGVMVVALGLTGSRSAWLGAAAMLALLAYKMLPQQKLRRWIKFGTIPLIVVAMLGLWLATSVPSLRLAVFHSGGNSRTESLTEGSSDQHWQATADGLQDIIADPLGAGVGTAGPASFYNTAGESRISEDYFVQIGQETGVAGLALFCIMSVLIFRALWRASGSLPLALACSFIGINVINIFLHGWADDPTAMTWWGLAGLFVGQPKQK